MDEKRMVQLTMREMEMEEEYKRLKNVLEQRIMRRSKKEAGVAG